ncbi:aminotransferase class V-fold PLP-dependent enzyme [uncultured Agrococcus sp.]|uniref:kynureninase n=1 Tax=uncultured Agrococcus sp. TaxID=382258 RepID=UPI0025F4B6D7|nr:aminotransferase class V-fold PLP-dependent enzyme [uncultured Agrococcus sp.]
MTGTRTAEELDAADALAEFRTRFVGHDDPGIPAYLDGNSLGRPTIAAVERWASFIDQQWGRRLIRGWDEGWYDAPLTLGDRIGALTLGAAGGQTIVGDSTTVSLYKVVRAALALRPDRDEIVVDRGNFPTDRYVAEGIARDAGATLRWIDVSLGSGVSVADVEAAVGPRTAVVLLSHVAFRSGFVADIPEITRVVHDAGGLVVWDLCHSVGVLPIELDTWGVDFATGCTYKYLNGGPGSPAFLYVRAEHIPSAQQPIQGWMGVRDSFAMGPEYEPAHGIRRFVSGTPPVNAMIGMETMLDLIEEAGIEAIRAKTIALTEYAIALYDGHLAGFGVELSSPRDETIRGGHVTIDHPAFSDLIEELWRDGVIPDFRPPSGIRLGLSPLSTSFAEVETAIDRIAAGLRARAA